MATRGYAISVGWAYETCVRNLTCTMMLIYCCCLRHLTVLLLPPVCPCVRRLLLCSYDYARRIAWGREDGDALLSTAFGR